MPCMIDGASAGMAPAWLATIERAALAGDLLEALPLDAQPAGRRSGRNSLASRSRRCCDRPHSSTSDSRSPSTRHDARGGSARRRAERRPRRRRATPGRDRRRRRRRRRRRGGRRRGSAACASESRGAPSTGMVRLLFTRCSGSSPNVTGRADDGVDGADVPAIRPTRPLAGRRRPVAGPARSDLPQPAPHPRRDPLDRAPWAQRPVAVALRDRPWPAVVADMVEGVVAANRLTGVRADHVRAGLWQVAGQVTELAA